MLFDYYPSMGEGGHKNEYQSYAIEEVEAREDRKESPLKEVSHKYIENNKKR